MTLYREAHEGEQGLGMVVVRVEPILVLCKHNTPDALTGSVFLTPVDYESVPEGEYALVRVGDIKDEIGGDE